MKQLVKNILILAFLVFTLMGSFLFYIAKTHHYYPASIYFSDEFEKALEDAQDFELIALGNSKLLASIDKKTLESQLQLKSAILGCSSANISTTRLTLESYLNKHQTKPKTLLLEVSWFSFNANRTNFHSLSGNLFLTDIKLWRYFSRYFPKIIDRIRSAIKGQIAQKIGTFQPINYDARRKKSSPNSKDYQFKVEYFEVTFPDHKAGVESLLLDDFYEIIKTCQIHNILLILYTAPEDRAYQSLQIDRKMIKSIFKKAANNSSVFYLDYTEDLWKKEYEFWLKNTHHINENKLFTKVLTNDIKSLMLKNNYILKK